MEEDRYQQEIAFQIERESKRSSEDQANDTDLVNEFKELVNTQKQMQEEKDAVTRLIQRKPKNPQANRKNYDDENSRMGVKNEIDLLLGEQEKQEEAKTKYDKELMKFS